MLVIRDLLELTDEVEDVGDRSSPGTRTTQGHALDVVGHREQVEGPQRGEPVALLGEVGRGRGPGPPGRRRRRRPRAAPARRSGGRPGAWRRPAAGRARRGPAGPTPRCSTRSTRPATEAAQGRSARLRRASVGGASVALDGQHRPRRARPPRPRNAGEQPHAGVQVEHRLPRLRREHLQARVSTSSRGASTWGCQKPSAGHLEVAAAARGLDVLDHRAATPARTAPGAAIRQSLDGHDVVRAVAAQAALVRRAGATYCIRARQASPSVGRPRAPARPSTSRSMPASRDSCSSTTAALSRRCSARSTCWKSQPPQAPGPA